MRSAATPATPGPAAALADALRRHDMVSFAAALDAEALVEVPPLHLAVTGRVEAATAVEQLVRAFPDLAYTVRQRYLAPGSVTDEAALEGTHAGEFMSAPPTGRSATVSVRVMLEHDELHVTRLTVWPDLGALRQVTPSLAATIDRTRHPTSAPLMVAQLRQLIPQGRESKVIVGRARQDAAGQEGRRHAGPAAGTERRGATSSGSSAAGRTRGAGPKSPVPRRVRRRRAVAAGAAMLVTSAGLVGWVARGALERPDGVQLVQQVRASTTPTRTAAPQASRSPSPSPSPRPSPSPSPSRSAAAAVQKEDAGGGQVRFTIKNELLFALGSSRLSPTSDATVQTIVTDLRAQRPSGRILVLGFTDSSGSSRTNERLSRERAAAVADALRPRVKDLGVTVEADGRGEIPGGATPAERSGNRKVTLTFRPGA